MSLKDTSKFYLIDSSQLANFFNQQRQQERFKPIATRELQRLDQLMLEIVNDDGLSQEEKIQKYTNALTEFQGIMKNSSPHRTTVAKPLLSNHHSNEGSSKAHDIPKKLDKSTGQSVDDYDPLLGIPLQYHNKAKNLLTLLKSSDQFKLSDNGEVIINDSKMAGTNINDLLNKTVNKRAKLENIPGWNDYTTFLEKLNPSQSITGRSVQELRSLQSKYTDSEKTPKTKEASPQSIKPSVEKTTPKARKYQSSYYKKPSKWHPY